MVVEGEMRSRRRGEMTREALQSGATFLVASALLATCFARAGVASEVVSKTGEAQVNPPSVSRHAARKLSTSAPRRTPHGLLAASGKDDRAYRLFPLILGISF